VGWIVALAGCIAAIVMVRFGLVAGIVAGIAAGMAVGLANGLIIARLGVNPFITTLGTMVLVRGVVYLITGGAPVGDEGLPWAFIAFGSARLLGIPFFVVGPRCAAGRFVLLDAGDALWRASVRDGRQSRSRLSLRRSGRADHRLDLCLVRRACWAGRRDAGRPPAIRAADGW